MRTYSYARLVVLLFAVVMPITAAPAEDWRFIGTSGLVRFYWRVTKLHDGTSTQYTAHVKIENTSALDKLEVRFAPVFRCSDSSKSREPGSLSTLRPGASASAGNWYIPCRDNVRPEEITITEIRTTVVK